MSMTRVVSRAALMTGCLATAIAFAPSASASGADAVINDLQAQGYLVQINWINGFDTKPLQYCTVTGVNNPDRSGAPMKPGDTVYVDVRCPNHIGDYDSGDVSFGVGLG